MTGGRGRICSGISSGCSRGSTGSRNLRGYWSGGAGDLRGRGGSSGVWCGSGLFK
jgi:hypothetical protein